ncbi:hypothetical protein R1sor_004582 [Riccia sorocarpa]|uniref:RRM domain-containing protein n=1 Tax=Riccia sorocarpa TaxID=122646 RepID=A0ABD3HJ33_9MARC
MTEDLRKFFQEHFGPVLDATVKMVKSGNQIVSGGFGFVTFEKQKIAQAALQTRAVTIHGRTVEIKEVSGRGSIQSVQDARSSGTVTAGKGMPRSGANLLALSHTNTLPVSSSVTSSRSSDPNAPFKEPGPEVLVVPVSGNQDPAAETSAKHSYASVIRHEAPSGKTELLVPPGLSKTDKSLGPDRFHKMDASVDPLSFRASSGPIPIPISQGCPSKSVAMGDSYLPSHGKNCICSWTADEATNVNSSGQPSALPESTGGKKNRNPRSSRPPLPWNHDHLPVETMKQGGNTPTERPTLSVETGSSSKSETHCPGNFCTSPRTWEQNFPKLSAAAVRSARKSVLQYSASTSESSVPQSSTGPKKPAHPPPFSSSEIYPPESLYNNLYEKTAPETSSPGPKSSLLQCNVVTASQSSLHSGTSLNEASVRRQTKFNPVGTIKQLPVHGHSGSMLAAGAQTLSQTRAIQAPGHSSGTRMSEYPPITPQVSGIYSRISLQQESWNLSHDRSPYQQTSMSRPTKPSMSYTPNYAPESFTHRGPALSESCPLDFNQGDLSGASTYLSRSLPEPPIYSMPTMSQPWAHYVPDGSQSSGSLGSTSVAHSAQLGPSLRPSQAPSPENPLANSWNGTSSSQLLGPQSAHYSGITLPERLTSSVTSPDLLERWNWVTHSDRERFGMDLPANPHTTAPDANPWNMTSVLEALPASEAFVPSSSPLSQSASYPPEWATHSWTQSPSGVRYTEVAPRSETSLMVQEFPDNTTTEADTSSTSYETTLQELSTSSGTTASQAPP